MKKSLILTIALLAISTSVFAADISSGVLPIGTAAELEPPVAAAPISTSFYIGAKASSMEQGLLLKYGTTDVGAELVDEVITSTSTPWEVFGTFTTDTFYFFGTGRAGSPKPVRVQPIIGPFKTTSFETDVVPTIIDAPTPNSYWEITIPALNTVGTGTYTGTYFQIAWDGSGSNDINDAPVGDYTAEITLKVTAE